MAKVFTGMTDGVRYYGAVAEDGWPTGPCQSEAHARERLGLYESGQEVSEAAPGQLSRAQLAAVLRWRTGVGSTFRDRLHALAADAQIMGLHSPNWVRASAAVVAVWGIVPESVRFAGGARLRRSAGEVSLTRGADSEDNGGVVGPRWI